jgi:hypothetical protein
LDKGKVSAGKKGGIGVYDVLEKVPEMQGIE